MLRAINPVSCGNPIGPYNNGLLAPAGQLLAIAGQAGTHPSGEIVSKQAGLQASAIFGKISSILEAAGGTTSDLIALTIYLRDAADYSAVNEARKAHLVEPYPVSATVTGIGFLSEDMLVEISALAVVGASRP